MYSYKINTFCIFEEYLADHTELVFEECRIAGKKIDSEIPPYQVRYIHHLTKAEFGIWILREENDLPIDID